MTGRNCRRLYSKHGDWLRLETARSRKVQQGILHLDLPTTACSADKFCKYGAELLAGAECTSQQT